MNDDSSTHDDSAWATWMSVHAHVKTTIMVQVGNERYPSTTACCDAAIVTVRWLGFHRIWQGSGEVFDSIDLFLPDVQFGTQVTAQVSCYVSSCKQVERNCCVSSFL